MMKTGIRILETLFIFKEEFSMKKFLALLLTLVMAMSLVACGGGSSASLETTSSDAVQIPSLPENCTALSVKYGRP